MVGGLRIILTFKSTENVKIIDSLNYLNQISLKCCKLITCVIIITYC